MSFVKIPFNITAHRAGILSSSNSFGVFGWDITQGDYAPFTPVWPQKNVFGEDTRFALPALMFDGQVVAQLGYRNKDGFMFVRKGLGQHAELALARRFQQMTEDAVRHNARHNQNIDDLRAHAIRIIKESPLLQHEKIDDRYKGFRASLDHVAPQLLRHAVVSELSKNPDILFSITGTQQDGRLDVVLRGAGASSLVLGSYSWANKYGRTACSATGEYPLTWNDMVMFAGACVGNHLRRIEATRDIDTAQLDNEIRGTDFGY